MSFVGILYENYKQRSLLIPKEEEAENVPSVRSLNKTTYTTMFDAHAHEMFGEGENI